LKSVLSPTETRWLSELLGYQPERLELYGTALTHRSAAEPNNERLEFLGDAVLGLVMAQEIYMRFPDVDEGSLSRLRAGLVSAGPLAKVGAEIGIGGNLQLGSGELRTGGFRRESILADATEALFGAVYLDRGLAAARELILRLYAPQLDSLEGSVGAKDAKTRLQECLQGRGEELPQYILEAAVGEPHEQTFTVRCEVALKRRAITIEGRGVGSSRRRAEQEAADAVLLQLPAGYAA
jgi:ribonuclease III